MTLRQVYIISILSLIPILGIAQDSTVVKSSKIGITLYADYSKPIEVLVTNQNKWEFGAGLILINKVALIGEYGYGNLQPASVINNGSYNSKGNYYRVGVEYIFTVAPRRYLSFGGMYASSSFSDEGIISIESEFWPSIEETFTRTNLTANWAEIILNTEAPLFRVEDGFFSKFYWGARLRVRILVTDLTQPNYDIFAVPGYGKTYSKVVPAFNLFLKYRIDL